MAIFYPHIKGLNINTSSNISYYTWIDFKNTSMDARPILKYSNTSNKGSATDYGAFVVTKYANDFERIQTFASGIKLDKYVLSASLNNRLSLYWSQSATVMTLSFPSDATAGSQGTLTFLPAVNLGSLTASGTITASSTIAAPHIVVSGSCEAAYFNATSDERAKEEIHELEVDALDIINGTSVYSFDYKDIKEPSIGIMAQDLKDLDLQGFNFVDNINATGQDGDFMKIKESKLIYVLWKGVQELSEKNGQLWEKIYKLEARIAQLEQK